MSGRIPIMRAIILIGGVSALGYGIMAATTPTEQQFYDALSPDLKRKVDEARALKAGAREEMAKASQDKLNTIREQARSEAPVWADAAPQDPKAKR
ncbi:hypothetical protein JCM8115_003347 [Rhodotorula mucilaginosa]